MVPPKRLRTPREAGFTMTELIIVLVVTGILSAVMGNFIAAPMQGYQDLARRTALVDAAESTLRRLGRDVRLALPNSIRVAGAGTVLELLHTADGARYRRAPGTSHTLPADWLDFAGDDQFNALGRLASLDFTYGTPLAAGHRLAVYTTGAGVYADADADADPGVITPSATTITLSDDGDEDAFQLSSSFQFRFESPTQRLYVVDTPVTYLCNLGASTLTRYAGYAIADPQPTDPGSAPLSGGSSARVADRVSGCTFTYDPGTPQRAGLLTVELAVSSGGESVRLLQQLHVSNAP